MLVTPVAHHPAVFAQFPFSAVVRLVHQPMFVIKAGLDRVAEGAVHLYLPIVAPGRDARCLVHPYSHTLAECRLNEGLSDKEVYPPLLPLRRLSVISVTFSLPSLSPSFAYRRRSTTVRLPFIEHRASSKQE